ncbi:TerB family tellurite resistance protein [Flavobacteriaceae bacterium]|nr:TerB family tellurite resistance protein [Flavobacteriaceae bacterium]
MKIFSSMIKWIGAALGYTYLRFGGAVLGYFIGSMIEGLMKRSSGASFNSTSFRTMGSNQFELNLLALAAMVIKADNKVEEKELRFVRNYFIANYGADYASTIFSKFNTEIKKEVQDLSKIARLFVTSTPYNTRLQIVHFLFGIANADGSVSRSELNKIQQIAAALGIRRMDIESVKAMFVQQAGNAYKILEIDSNATDAEVKKAYRTMAKKHHPDKLNTADQALKKGAQEKFQQIQAAYEKIQRERGL